MDVQPVVVGVDGSSASRDALTWAVDEARLHGAPLHIVHARQKPVHDPVFEGGFVLPPVDDGSQDVDVALAGARELVRDLAPDLAVETWFFHGPPASVLLDQATDGALLLVVGSRGLGAWGSLFLGSVSARLAARSSVPVLVVPPGSPRAADGGPVVVGVDGSPHSKAAVRAAAREAAARGVPLDLVTAFSVPADLLVGPLVPPPDEVRAQVEDRARRAVEAGAQRAREAEPDLEVRASVVEGQAAQVLAQVAGSRASVVAVGSRGHGTVVGPVLGSVSQSVLHHARWPVLVVHAED